jgi:fatty acid synthase subunit beta, fungi type
MDSTIGSETSESYDVLNNTTCPGTPSSYTPASLVSLTVRFGELRQEFLVPSRDAQFLDAHQTSFNASLAAESPQIQPRSATTLALRFLNYLMDRDIPSTVLRRVFRSIHTDVLRNEDIHDVIGRLPDDYEARNSAINTYLRLSAKFPPEALPVQRSSLFSVVKEQSRSVLIAFGGQGAMNPVCVHELGELYSTYQPLTESLIEIVDPLLQELSRHPDTNSFYLGREVELRTWLKNPSARPTKGFISGAAVSLPIIGIIDLMYYCIVLRLLGKTPGDMAQLVSGVTGHSQGIVVAAAVAMSDSWESYWTNVRWAVELLFWLGYEAQRGAPQSCVSSSAVQDSLKNGYGVPSHMLAVRGLRRNQLERTIADCNQHLPAHSRLYYALRNGPTNHVVAGAPKSLRGLTLGLEQIRAENGLDQTRVPYSKRKPVITCQFLPISAPFHSQHLWTAAERVKARFPDNSAQSRRIAELGLSTFHTSTGQELRQAENSSANLSYMIIDAVYSQAVDWPKALGIGSPRQPTDVVVFGGGRLTDLVHQIVDGRGIRVLNGTNLQTSNATVLGPKAGLFAANMDCWQHSPRPWAERFKPEVRRDSSGRIILQTRLNKLLNAPPIITAGMTPTTVPWDFVSAVMNAGYHIELAGGGYWNAATMTTAIDKLAASIPIGRGITCNLIYVSPAAIAFQIPLIRQMIERGLPIDGLTIGAGVPSPDVAAEYIQTLGLKHISFKPGSLGAIREVLTIARVHPKFPVILQWTGGRGGGHHSCEDFHEPLIEAYGEIRNCSNVYLVVGSGFGDGAGCYKYLTGDWSLPFGRPAMPCDGILMGSRMMVAREAHTSTQAKKLLIRAPGVEDAKWESSYDESAAAGNVLTVRSEMGQPIHKLATRGVRLWKDLDDTIFNLPRAERAAALQKRKAEIIRRLNVDFAKPWFGRLATGEVADLEDMTYGEVSTRLVELMHVHHQKRWIDPTYRELVDAWITRTFQRLDSTSNLVWDPSLLQEPESGLLRVFEACPDARKELLHPEDARFFANLCKQRGRKPPNFIVALDDDFEFWFKKDSLWQSEDVDAVVDQDPERVCILQSPVSVRFSTRDDQTAKEILDGIQQEIVTLLQKADHGQEVGDVMPLTAHVTPEVDSHIMVEETENYLVFRNSSKQELHEHSQWMKALGANTSRAIHAVLTARTIYQSSTHRCQPNPFYQVFAPRDGFSVLLRRDGTEAILIDDHSDSTIAQINLSSGGLIRVQLSHNGPIASNPALLTFDWAYDDHTRRLIDNMVDRDRRIQSFYAHLWLGHTYGMASDRLVDIFRGDEVVLTKRLHRTLNSVIAHAFADDPSLYQHDSIMPLEAAVISSWEVLMRPILVSDLAGDLLRLVHRSMHIAYVTGASPLTINDIVTAQSSVRSVMIEPSGKSVVVQAQIERKGTHVVTLTSEFFIKGEFSDFESTFRHTVEPEMEFVVNSDVEEAIIRDREWVVLKDPSIPLKGMRLIFQLTTHTNWSDRATISRIETRGIIQQAFPTGTRHDIGTVLMDIVQGKGNPIIEFLQRRGKAVKTRAPLTHPGWDGVSQKTIRAPSHSTPLYATVSGDYNPIHTSPVFAAMAGLPGPILHGMYTAAVCRKVVEDLVLGSDVTRLHSFKAEFVGMVTAGDRLTVDISHKAMQNGRMVFKVLASQAETGERVLQGEAEVDQPPTVYVFTGQGSQSKGMGMALYESSPVARALWDDMDEALMDQFGKNLCYTLISSLCHASTVW